MLQHSSNRSLIFHLILYSLIGAFLAGFIALFLAPFIPTSGDDVWMLRVSIILQDMFVMFFPAYLVFKFSAQRPFYMLGMKKDGAMGEKLLFSLSVYIAAVVGTSVLAMWNANIVFPEFLSGLETIFRDMEDSAMETTKKFFSGSSFSDLAINIFVAAFMAALVEEMFFRGALQQLLSKWFNNGHVAVWVTAFIFSAIHLQFFGFVPRLIMGAILGYLFLYTRNLWVPFFYHFVNNTMVIIVNFYWGETSFVKEMDATKPTIAAWILLCISFVVTLALFAKWGRKLQKAQYN